MNWFEERKKAERREAILFVLNMIFWLIVGVVALQFVGWPW